MLKNQNIFITGGNRGIGKGLVSKFCKENKVIFTVRTKQKGDDTLKDFDSPNIDYLVMDVDNQKAIKKSIRDLRLKYNNIDILINNAGILIPDLQSSYNLGALNTSEDSILATFQTNTLGSLRVCKEIVPLMKNGGRIINISSGMGQLHDMEGGSISYRLSKTALNALTKILSVELKELNIKVNAICPGWVKTDMGGSNADLRIEESTKNIANFVLADKFPNGKFFRHGIEIPW